MTQRTRKPRPSGLLIGYGNMGCIHDMACRVLGVSVTSAVDSNHELKTTLRTKGKAWYPDVESVPAAPSIDFAIIATPTDFHLRNLIEVIERFPHVKGILIEKPPIHTMQELHEIRRLPLQVQACIFVGEVEHYNERLRPFFGYHGSISRLEIERNVNLDFFLRGNQNAWFLDENRSGGIVIDLMIHDINLLVGKYGLPQAITDVKGAHTKFSGVDSVQATLEYQGFSAVLSASWASPDTTYPIRVRIVMTSHNGRIHEAICDDYMTPGLKSTNPYIVQMDAFLRSLSAARTPYPLSLYLDAMELALDIRARLHI